MIKQKIYASADNLSSSEDMVKSCCKLEELIK